MLRAYDYYPSHPVPLKKVAELLFHDAALAAGGMTHQKAFAVAYENAGVKEIEIFSGGGEEDKVAGVKAPGESRKSTLRYRSYRCPSRGETRYHVEKAFVSDCWNTASWDQVEHAFAQIVAHPSGHVVVALLPFDPAVLVANLAQPLDEPVDGRSTREG